MFFWGDKYKDRRIFKNIFLSCFGLPVLCLIIAGIMGFSFMYKVQIDQKKNSIINVLNSYSIMIDNQLDAVENSIENLQNDTYVKRLIARNEFTWDDDMNIAAKEIVNNLAVNSDFHSIYLISNGEYILKSTGPNYPLNQEADRNMVELFYNSNYGQFTTYDYIDIYGKEKTLLSLSRGEIDSFTGNKKGGVLISLDIRKILDDILLVDSEGEMYFLVNSSGETIYSKANNEDIVLPSELILQISNNNSYALKRTIVDKKYMCIGNRVRDGFYLINLIPYDYISGPIRFIGLIFIAIVVLLGAVLFIIAFNLSKRVYTPIDAVVTSAGDSEELSKNLEGTELELVAQTYHFMMRNLNELNDAQEMKALADYLVQKKAIKKIPAWFIDNYDDDYKNIRCLSIRISDLESFLENNTEEAISFVNKNLQSMIRQHCQSIGVTIAVPIDQEYIAAIIMTKESCSDDFIVERIKSLQNMIKETLSLSVDIGISSERHDISEMHDMYQLARASTAYRFILGIGVVITEQEMTNRALASHEKPDISVFMQKVRSSDQEGYRNEIDKIFEQLRNLSIQNAREVILEMAVEITKYQNSLAYNITSLTSQDYDRLSRELDSYSFISDIVTWFDEKCVQIWNMLLDAQKNSKEDIVDKAIHFLEENYRNINISSQYLADMYHITPSYFSRLFNEKTKYAFPDYLSTLRMDKARELLLQHPESSIQEICDQVGYANPSYFTATFKKKYGITPGQFRKKQDFNSTEII